MNLQFEPVSLLKHSHLFSWAYSAQIRAEVTVFKALSMMSPFQIRVFLPPPYHPCIWHKQQLYDILYDLSYE